MQAVILAGGTGSRLKPSTIGVNKHLHSIYNKPLFYYPLSVAVLAGARNIVLVVNPGDAAYFQIHADELSIYGIKIQIALQENPKGIGDGLIAAKSLLNPNESTLLLLGDNITFGYGLGTSLRELVAGDSAVATCFATEVNDPQNFGVVTLVDGVPISIEEKPLEPKSSLAIIGIYHLPKDSFDRLQSISPSRRGELEITDLLSDYLESNLLTVRPLSRGTAWLDAGTAKSMLEASNFVQIIEERQGLLVGSPHEAALRTNLISREDFEIKVRSEGASDYFEKLKMLVTPIKDRRH